MARDWSIVSHWKCSISSAASMASDIERFLGEWNCCQSRASTNLATGWRRSAMEVDWSLMVCSERQIKRTQINTDGRAWTRTGRQGTRVTAFDRIHTSCRTGNKTLKSCLCELLTLIAPVELREI